MGKTFKDDKDYRDILKPLKVNKRKMTFEEKEKLRDLREDMHYDRLMKQGFS